MLLCQIIIEDSQVFEMLGNYVCFTTFPKIDDLLCIFVTFNYGESIKVSTYNHTILKCRQLIFENSDVIAYPNLEQMYGIYVIVKETYYKIGALQAYLKAHNLKYNAPSSVSQNTYEECCFYTIVTKLAPKWNMLSNYLIRGRNFLTCITPTDCISWQIFINSHGEATFNFKIGRIKMCTMSLEKLNLTDTLIHEFKTNGVIKFRHNNSVTVRVLPSLKEGQVLQISKYLKSENFIDYQHMKRHWKNTYGYRLPDNDTGVMYLDISFFDGSPVFTYPSICVRPYNPVFMQRCEPTTAIAVFITDLLKTIPKILGSSYPVPSHISKPTCGLSSANQETLFPNTSKISISSTSYHRHDLPVTENSAFLVLPNKVETRIGTIQNERNREDALKNLIDELNKDKPSSRIIISQLSESDTEATKSAEKPNQISTVNTQLYKPTFSKVSNKFTQKLSPIGKPICGEEKSKITTHYDYPGNIKQQNATFSRASNSISQNLLQNQMNKGNTERNDISTNIKQNGGSTNNMPYKPIFTKVSTTGNRKISDCINLNDDTCKNQTQNESEAIKNVYKPIFSKELQFANHNTPQTKNEKYNSLTGNNTLKIENANENQNQNCKPYAPIFSKTTKLNIQHNQSVSNTKKNMALQMRFLTKNLAEKSISEEGNTSNAPSPVPTGAKLVPKFAPKILKNVPGKPTPKINKHQNKVIQVKNTQKQNVVKISKTNIALPKQNIVQLNRAQNDTSKKEILQLSNQNTLSKPINNQQNNENKLIFYKENISTSSNSNVITNSVMKTTINSTESINLPNSVPVNHLKSENKQEIKSSQQNKCLPVNKYPNFNNFSPNPPNNVAVKTLPIKNTSQEQNVVGIGSQKEQNKRPGSDKKDNESSAPKKVKTKPIIQEISDSEMKDRMRNNTLDKVNVPTLTHWLKEKSIAVTAKDKKSDLISKIKFILSAMDD